MFSSSSIWPVGYQHRSVVVQAKDGSSEVQLAARALQPGTKLNGYTVDKVTIF